MATEILIDGPGAPELATATRATLGRRPESEEHILPFVVNQPPSSIDVWPGNGSWGWTYPGPARRTSTSAA
jgi:hypothetical protein